MNLASIRIDTGERTGLRGDRSGLPEGARTAARAACGTGTPGRAVQAS